VKDELKFSLILNTLASYNDLIKIFQKYQQFYSIRDHIQDPLNPNSEKDISPQILKNKVNSRNCIFSKLLNRLNTVKSTRNRNVELYYINSTDPLYLISNEKEFYGENEMINE